MLLLGTATFKNIYFKHQIFDRPIYIYIYLQKKKTCIRSFFNVVWNFIWREELWPVIHSFNRTGLFWMIISSRVFFYHEAVAVIHSFKATLFITPTSCSHPFFQGLYGTDDFWQQHTYYEQLLFWKSYLT